MGVNLSKALGKAVSAFNYMSNLLNHSTLILSIGKIFGNKEMRLLMLGLDAAGKTSSFTIKKSLMLPER
jgi:hypothetical protein